MSQNRLALLVGAIIVGIMLASLFFEGHALAADKTCAAGATSCIRDRLRENCVLLNPPFRTNKVTRWRCPDPHP